MTNAKRISRTATAVVLIALVLSAGVNSFSQTNIRVYVKTGGIDWKALFTEPFEILYLVLYDSTIKGITTQEESRINIGAEFVKEYLEEDDYKISDIAIIVHNHFRSPFLSWADKLFLKDLRRRGFEGSFGVYQVSTGKIKWAEAEDEEESKK